MLGRCETIEDMFIIGDFDPKQIRADQQAEMVTRSMNEVAREREFLDQELHDSSTVIGSLNVRSLRKHFEDVLTDPFIMKCDIFGLCETWLHKGEEPIFPNFNGIYVNSGRGKGIAVFTKEPLDYEVLKLDDASAVFVKHEELDVIFVYLSQNFEWHPVREFFDNVIRPKKPTVIMGDVNWHYSDDHPMKDYLQSRVFTQLITRATHKEGRCIDHLYASRDFGEEEITLKQQSVPYSDHDLITAFVPK